MTKIDRYGKCPECGIDFKGEKIFDTFKQQQKEGYECWKNKTDQEIFDVIQGSYSEPYYWSNLIGIEEREKYDGISFWQCPICKCTWDKGEVN